MIFISMDDNNNSKIIKKLLLKKNKNIKVKVDVGKFDDFCYVMKKSKIIVCNYSFFSMNFSLLKHKKILLIIEDKRKISKAERKFLKEKKVYCCKSAEQAVYIADYMIKQNNIRRFFLVLLAVLFTIIFVIFFINVIKQSPTKTDDIIDYKKENIVFIGDSITDYYDLNKYFPDLPIVNSGMAGYKTDDVYDTLYEKLYIYNPTKVFLLIGTNDFLDSKSNEYIVDKIIEIIEEIKKNRPLAKIYLQSIYPVNNTNHEQIGKEMVANRDNTRIRDVNKSLKEYCKEDGNCEYIDIYSILQNDDGDINLDYTTEGLHISDKGYEVITKHLMPYIERVEK